MRAWNAVKVPLTPVPELSPNLDDTVSPKAESEEDGEEVAQPHSSKCWTRASVKNNTAEEISPFAFPAYVNGPVLAQPIGKTKLQASSVSEPNLVKGQFIDKWACANRSKHPIRHSASVSAGESTIAHRDNETVRGRAVSELQEQRPPFFNIRTPSVTRASIASPASRRSLVLGTDGNSSTDSVESLACSGIQFHSFKSLESRRNSTSYNFADIPSITAQDMDSSTMRSSFGQQAGNTDWSNGKSGLNVNNANAANIYNLGPRGSRPGTSSNVTSVSSLAGASHLPQAYPFTPQPQQYPPQAQQLTSQAHQLALHAQQFAPQAHQFASQAHQFGRQEQQFAPQAHQFAPQIHQFASQTFQHDISGRETSGGVAIHPYMPNPSQLAYRLGGLKLNPSFMPLGSQASCGSNGYNSKHMLDQDATASSSHEIYGQGYGQNIYQGNDQGLSRSPDHTSSPKASNVELQPQSTIQTSQTSSMSKASEAKQLAAYIMGGGLERERDSARMGYNHNPRAADFTPQSRASSVAPGDSRSGTFQHLAPPNGPLYHKLPPRDATPPDPIVAMMRTNGGPTWAEIVQNLPFIDRAIECQSGNYGVIKLSDIPFSVTKQEIVAVMGEKARLLKMPDNTGGYAIHVIMERSTAKSMDAFVEFEDHDSALMEANRLADSKRLIGSRKMKVDLSSEAELMQQLFPRAKCINWHGASPVLNMAEDEEAIAKGFTGFKFFLSSEEMFTVSKIASAPGRYQFANRHPQRTYESMISVMAKYPWSKTYMYTLRERNYIAKCVTEQITAIAEHINNKGSQKPLDCLLLHEYLRASLQCPGFSDKQHAAMIDASAGLVPIDVFVTPIAKDWPGEVIGIREQVSTELSTYVVDLMRSADFSKKQNATTPQGQHGHAHFGGHMTLGQLSHARSLNVRKNLPAIKFEYPANKEELKMGEIAEIEWKQIETLISKIVIGQ